MLSLHAFVLQQNMCNPDTNLFGMGALLSPWSAERACACIAGEDLWHCYNLIRDGDHVTATTFRKVARDSGAGSESEKVRLRLTIAVEGVDFDPEGAYGACVGNVPVIGYQREREGSPAAHHRGGGHGR